MSDTPSTPSSAASASLGAPDAPVAPLLPASSAAANAWWRSRTWALLVLILALVGALGCLMLWQKLSHIQEELARRSTDTGTQAVEARTLARQAQDSSRELAARLAVAENRISEVNVQRGQLDDLMQSLSRSRDDNLVVEMDANLRLAQQQAQLTGSAEPLLAALKSAELRLDRAAQPRLSPVRRAIAKDAERIKSAALTDVPAMLLKLDELVRQVDGLPVANDVLRGEIQAATGLTVPVVEPLSSPVSPAIERTGFARFFDVQALSNWSGRLLQGLREDAQSLLRVSRIDRPEAALLAPEQSYFLRENIKLKLLNARLALLSRQTDAARSDLTSVQSTLSRYFDASSRKTQAAKALLQQTQAELRTGELPRFDETLAALATAAAGR
ncbi:MAG: uroporphyrinogen-III C-methyltransferase [Polaromonas sp.]|nr:uroporphyrinogen-III C-methyltransferase [Polaromonas sp.]